MTLTLVGIVHRESRCGQSPFGAPPIGQPFYCIFIGDNCYSAADRWLSPAVKDKTHDQNLIEP